MSHLLQQSGVTVFSSTLNIQAFSEHFTYLEGIQGHFSLTFLKFVLAEILKAEVLRDRGFVKFSFQ